MAASALSLRELLGRLVAFDSTSSRSNLDLIAFVADYLDAHGVATHLTYDREGRKANVYGRLGPEAPGGVALSGHTDCVPIDGQAWDSDPFTVTERDGRLYGRGSADMKSFIAAALAVLPEVRPEALRAPLSFAFTYDEEVGCIGVYRLIEALREGDHRPAQVLVGEPTGMRVIDAHKGIHSFRTTFSGRAAHSSRPDLGTSAISAAARAVAFLDDLARARSTTPEAASRFEIPYTTINVGRIRGGEAVNIIPGACVLDWEYRPLPGEDGNAIRVTFESWLCDELLRATPDLTAVTEPVARVPAFVAGAASPARGLAFELTGSSDSGVVPFATEAGIFEAAGMPAVVCGPGDIAQAHQPNEFITAGQLDAGLELVRGVVRRLASPSR